jgi:hypothetical protein
MSATATPDPFVPLTLQAALDSGHPDKQVAAVAYELLCVLRYHERRAGKVKVGVAFIEKMVECLEAAMEDDE